MSLRRGLGTTEKVGTASDVSLANRDCNAWSCRRPTGLAEFFRGPCTEMRRKMAQAATQDAGSLKDGAFRMPALQNKRDSGSDDSRDHTSLALT